MTDLDSSNALAARLELPIQDAPDSDDGGYEHPMLLAPRVMRRPSRTGSLESLYSPGISMDALMVEDELYIGYQMSRSRKYSLSPLVTSPLELLQASPEFHVGVESQTKTPDRPRTSPGPPIPSESPILPLSLPLRPRDAPPKPPPAPRHRRLCL
jgi:hypothetical protein